MPIRYDLMQRFSFTLAIINLGGTLLFAALLFVIPIFTTLSVHGRFIELDRANLINTQNLANMPESANLKLGNDSQAYRTQIPDYIAESHKSAQRFAATCGIIFCLGNTVIWFGTWTIQKRASVAIEKMPKKPGTPTHPANPDDIDIAIRR